MSKLAGSIIDKKCGVKIANRFTDVHGAECADSSINYERSPVLLTSEAEFSTWLAGSDEASRRRRSPLNGFASQRKHTGILSGSITIAASYLDLMTRPRPTMRSTSTTISTIMPTCTAEAAAITSWPP